MVSVIESPYIVHATTVHPWNDNRIFHKLVSTLAERGWPVVYAARSTSPTPKIPSSIEFIPLGELSGLRGRVRRNAAILYELWRRRAGIFHFHDPELMIVGLLLRLRGWQVVYDVHEDNYLALRQKEYLSKPMRYSLAWLVRALEFFCSYLFSIVIAERAYVRRFPRAVQALNYPKGTTSGVSSAMPRFPTLDLIYTGSVSIDRGARLFKDVLDALPRANVTVCGYCSDANLRNELKNLAQRFRGRLILDVSDHLVPFERIDALYRSRTWAYGLALFPTTPHYCEKELTKFFEYMKYGIPILCSNFPVWRALIDGNGCGISVPPEGAHHSLVALSESLGNLTKWQAMQSASLAVASRCTWENEYRKVEELYWHILNHTARSATNRLWRR